MTSRVDRLHDSLILSVPESVGRVRNEGAVTLTFDLFISRLGGWVHPTSDVTNGFI